MKNIWQAVCLVLLICLTACTSQPETPIFLPTTIILPTQFKASATVTPISLLLPGPTASPTQTEPSATPTLSPTPRPQIPDFSYIIFIVFENKEYTSVIGNRYMPNYNRLASEYTLLNQHYAIMHPSLPNYIAMIAGDTFRINTNYPKEVIVAPSLPDFIEASGRSWKTYQDNMPQPCGLQDTLKYVQKHNPFVFFNSIRNDARRCEEHVVPLTELKTDIKQDRLPNFVFITPDLCNSAHDSYTNPENCGVQVADAWLNRQVEELMAYQPVAQNGVIIVTWDEGQGDHGCCGLGTGGGRVPTLLISSKVKKGFVDETPYTHYSLLKTVSEAWVLPALGHAADPETALITAPWMQ